MHEQHFIANNQITTLTIDGYKDWFARNQRIGTFKSSVMEYSVEKLLAGLETQNGSLYRIGKIEEHLTSDGLVVELRQSDWFSSTDSIQRDRVSFPVMLSSTPDAVIFGLHDCSERWHPVLDLDAWDFFTISGPKLSSACADADRISLPALLMLGPVWSDYNGIPDAIQKAMGA